MLRFALVIPFKRDRPQRMRQTLASAATGKLCAVLSAVLVLGACGNEPRDESIVQDEVATADDAVAQPPGVKLVLPARQTRFFFDVSQRQVVGNLTGKSVEDPEKVISLMDYEGKVLVLSIWSSWCPPCRNEADDFNRIQQASKEVQVLGVNIKDAMKPAREFIDDFGVTYPSIFDPTGQFGLTIQGIPINGLPITLILDREQKAAAVFIEPVTDADVLPAVQRVLTEG